MSWLSLALLACAVAVLVAAEAPRLGHRLGADARRSRARERRKQNLRLIRPAQPDPPASARSESEEFAASVERDLALLPTTDEQEERGGRRSSS